MSWTGHGSPSTRPAFGPPKGVLTGPTPTDRGKNGSKIHLVTDRSGLPVAVAVSAANTHDSLALQPLIASIPPVRSRRGPRRRRPDKLHGDKGYDYPYLRRWLRERGITPRIVRRGKEGSHRLGRHRWAIERTMSWLGRLPPTPPPLRWSSGGCSAPGGGVAGGPQLLAAFAICWAAWSGVRCVVSTTSASACSHVRAASA
ncbi:transposase [Streptosporangium nondiastaticum]|uniref:transposase n=1 Tax=Streptosporangium nondiastaticum TaxID=35764 RepID=UPI003369EF4B